jgi:hypothetical protein
MTLSNFLIIGAAKAGTTSLYDWMRQHPDVYMPAFKEPKFFAWDGAGKAGGGPVVQVTSREEYEALFDGAGDATAIGEASTLYLTHHRAPERVAEAIPAARLIASLRDPVERAFSIYQMNLRLFGANEGVSFPDALHADPALRQGYAPALARWREHFGPEQLEVILFEDIARDAPGTLARLFGFLGVDPTFAPDVSKVANPGGLPRSRRLHALLTDPRLRAIGRNLLPAGALDRLKSLRRRNLATQTLGPGDRAAAVVIFREDILKTQDLLGQDLSAWLAT